VALEIRREAAPVRAAPFHARQPINGRNGPAGTPPGGTRLLLFHIRFSCSFRVSSWLHVGVSFFPNFQLTRLGNSVSFFDDPTGRFQVKRIRSNRVAERLRRLRERFGEDVREHQVDHDHDNITSTKRDLISVRTFYLGEIWWAERYALGNQRSHREGGSHIPALVTRREAQASAPIEMAPSAQRAPADIDELCFCTRELPEGLREETWFLLPYRRPVARHAIGAPMGSISAAEKQWLAQMILKFER